MTHPQTQDDEAAPDAAAWAVGWAIFRLDGAGYGQEVPATALRNHEGRKG